MSNANTLAVMEINGARYVESKPKRSFDLLAAACGQCALGGESRRHLCELAMKGAAAQAFGGSCDAREVIYITEAAAQRKRGRVAAVAEG